MLKIYTIIPLMILLALGCNKKCVNEEMGDIGEISPIKDYITIDDSMYINSKELFH